MGCLQASITRIGAILKGTVTRAVPSLRVYIDRAADLVSASVILLNKPVRAVVTDAAIHPTVKISMVCTLAELREYLFVSPEEVQWVTPDYGIVYNVESNVEWIVITS